MSDQNPIYEPRSRIKGFGIIDQDEVDRFASTFYRGQLSTQERILLEGLVREAVARYELLEDKGQQEEFRQLLKSYMRFYSFLAQVIRLDDTQLEKLHAYASWLVRLLPNREVPPEVEITEEMLQLTAFRVEETKAQYKASLDPGDRSPLKPISELGAKPYTEDEERTLSEIRIL